MKRRIGIQGMLMLSAALAAVLLCEVVFPRWQNRRLDAFLDVAGLALVILGFLFRISARGYKEEGSSGGSRLVTGGPYALARNPMYFGTFLIGTGFVMVLFEWWAWLVFTAVFLCIYIPQVRREEAVLKERFGQEYAAYCAAVPKYFPRLNRLLAPKKYLPLKLAWIKKEILSFIVTLAVLVIVELWRSGYE
jgi:protein-S-isoprenylcysteine O-methyltransferase Ste14